MNGSNEFRTGTINTLSAKYGLIYVWAELDNVARLGHTSISAHFQLLIHKPLDKSQYLSRSHKITNNRKKELKVCQAVINFAYSVVGSLQADSRWSHPHGRFTL